jgi:hypothetical protein
MSSRCALIEVYPNYKEDGRVDYNLPFSYGCDNLMGYDAIDELIEAIRKKLLKGDENKLVLCKGDGCTIYTQDSSGLCAKHRGEVIISKTKQREARKKKLKETIV